MSYLLGIRDASQFYSHPLVGNIFENMVVVEAVKHRLNQGLEPDCWFYRNSSGSIEVDLLFEDGGKLLFEDGGKLHPREIKSSSTFSSDMREHLETFSRLASNVARSLVVYSGETHTDVAVNFADVSDWCR